VDIKTAGGFVVICRSPCSSSVYTSSIEHGLELDGRLGPLLLVLQRPARLHVLLVIGALCRRGRFDVALRRGERESETITSPIGTRGSGVFPRAFG
jgi:hypothetical protein